MRFKNKFNFSIEIDSKMEQDSISIPPMLIQPYVENAILHGLMKKDSEGMIDISIQFDKGSVLCAVRDNGIGREKAKELKNKSEIGHHSVGMLITKERLEILNSKSASDQNIKITDLKDEEGNSDGTMVEIVIPYVTDQ